jgi:hypothetical protein
LRCVETSDRCCANQPESVDLWVRIFGEFDKLIAEPHSHYAHSQSEHALEVLIVLAGDFGVGDLLEGEHLGIEIYCAVDVGNGDADCINAVYQRGRLLGESWRHCEHRQ